MMQRMIQLIHVLCSNKTQPEALPAGVKLHKPFLTVTRPSLLALSKYRNNCSGVRSYPGTNLSMLLILSKGKVPTFVSMPRINYERFEINR